MTDILKEEKEPFNWRHLAEELFTAYFPRPRLVREGFSRVGLALALGALLAVLGRRGKGKPAALAGLAGRLLIAAGALAAFAYRNPRRIPLGNAPDYIYAPVDGQVSAVEELEDEPQFLHGPAYRIRLSSAVLTAPLVRAPLPGTLQYIYQPSGEPQVKIGLETPEKRRVLLVLSADRSDRLRLPAPLGESRAILMRTEAGASLPVVGELGVRGFGVPVLTELYLPDEKIDILCSPGQTVQAGKSVIGRIKPA